MGALTAIAALSLVLAFLVRFDFSIPSAVSGLLIGGLLAIPPAKGIVFHAAGFHRVLLRFVGLPDLLRIAAANMFGSALLTLAMLLWAGAAFPRSVLIIDFLFCFLFTSLFYFSERIHREVLLFRKKEEPKGILIYGAGVGGTTLLRELNASCSVGYDVIGFLDDDPAKQHGLVMGIPVLGRGRDAAWIIDQLNKSQRTVEEIVIAMPSATAVEMREAIANCRTAGVPTKTIPGVRELLNHKVLSAQIREPSITDLLGRQSIRLDESPVRSRIQGQCVLVTGAAGSIGSELCRQVAKFGPAKLVALDQSESELFRIENEIREGYPSLELAAALADIRDPDRLSEVIRCNSVDSVFHAAAYKHVPMMESHVLEAVRNNILGTWNLIQVVREYRIQNFLMISSDKAVNPTNVMGASKRVCELIVSAVPENRTRAAQCVSVRFGNVLGSNGSVVPIFQAQIAGGGPVKVTHPDMQRYFMTTSEAVSLVLQASTMGQGSEIFVLDMGSPVRIVSLAENMIRLAGLTPYVDIDIEFTGPRPGEKLFEEINGAADKMLPTYHEKIKIFQDGAPVEWRHVVQWIDQLRSLLAGRQPQPVVAHIRSLVPEYRPAGAKQNDSGNGKTARTHHKKSEPAVYMHS
jgi:FlaA1/EpsC-like NDP-sugar epimerase